MNVFLSKLKTTSKNIFFLLFVTSLLLSGCSSDNEPDKQKKKPEATFLDPQLRALEDAKKVEAKLLARDEELRKKLEEKNKSKEDDDTQ